MDMVGYDVAVVGERFLAESAFAILQSNLPVEEFPHFTVGAEFPVSPGMMRIFDAPNAHLARPFLSGLLLCRSRRENGESGTVDYGGVSWCSPD